jgi:hypothetical protein
MTKKSIGSMKKMKVRVEEAYKDIQERGDFSSIEALATGRMGAESYLMFLKEVQAKSIEGMMSLNDSLVSSMPKRNVAYHSKRLFDELLARAFVANHRCLQKEPRDHIKTVASAFVRLQKSFGDKAISSRDDPESTLEFFKRTFEIYLKVLHVSASLIDTIEGKKPSSYQQRGRTYRRLREFENGRYAMLVPDDTSTIMRDAIAHESIEYSGNERIRFESTRETRRLSCGTVDRRVAEMLQRLIVFTDSASILEVYSHKTAEIELMSRVRERKRTMKEMRN